MSGAQLQKIQSAFIAGWSLTPRHSPFLERSVVESGKGYCFEIHIISSLNQHDGMRVIELVHLDNTFE